MPRLTKYGLPYYRTNPDLGRRCGKSFKRVSLSVAWIHRDVVTPTAECPECGAETLVEYGTRYLEDYSWSNHFALYDEPIEVRTPRPDIGPDSPREVYRESPPF